MITFDEWKADLERYYNDDDNIKKKKIPNLLKDLSVRKKYIKETETKKAPLLLNRPKLK